MFLNRTTSKILLALAGLSVGCKQAPPSATAQQVAAHAVPTWTPGQPAAPQREASASNTPQAGQQARVVAEQPKLEDVEERKGPLTIGGQSSRLFCTPSACRDRRVTLSRLSRHWRSSTPVESSSIAKSFPTPSRTARSRRAAGRVSIRYREVTVRVSC